MALDDDINDLLGNQAGPKTSTISNKPASLVSKNDCEARRERTKVNASILKNTMKEWTNTIENQDEQDSQTSRKIEIHKDGEKNIWQAHKEFIAKEDSFGGGIMRLLYQGLDKKNSVSEENNSLAEMARLQSERTSRLHHEQLMAKSRMGRKIKSKSFHRHMKRREIKEFMKKDETETNPDKLREKLEQFEKIRAKERISLKHKTGGRFAKIQKLRAKYDPIARDALNAMHDKARELMTKNNDPLDEDDSSNDVDTDTEMVEPISDDEEEENDPEMMASGDGEYNNSAAHKARSFVERMGHGSAKPVKRGPVVATVLSTNQDSYLQQNDDDEIDDIATGDDQLRFKDTILDMYQTDETLAEDFEREKRELVEKEKPEDLQTFLPGWGCWTGPGYEEADRKRKKRGLIRAPTGKRKDSKKAKVWIRQGVHDGLKKHLVKSIPYPYNTVEQFNLSRKELVSSAFNLQTVHRQLIKPKFENRAGVPIYPIQKHEKKSVQ